MMSFHHFILLALAAATKASSIESTFKSTCTIPNKTTHFVSSPDTRGTLDILWSCLFTIIACTLTIQHLNVPEQREGRDPGWRGDLKWSLRDTLRSLKWMLITVLAPEILVGKGMGDLHHAKLSHTKLANFARDDGVPWSMTHTLFADMGGFVIRRSREGNADINPKIAVTNPNGEAVVATEPVTIQHLHPDPYHVMAEDIIILRTLGTLSKLPYITMEEINDKSKANLFIKAIAVTQILWMIVQILVRTTRKLATSQLEISVLAFSVCAVIIYFLYWQKPKDIMAPYTLILLHAGTFDSTIPLLWPKEIQEMRYLPLHATLALSFGFSWKGVKPGQPIPNDRSAAEYYLTAQVTPHDSFAVGFFFGCATFGGIHIAAWNFHFPTKADLILWRVASIFCTGFPFTSLLVLFAHEVFADRVHTSDETDENLSKGYKMALTLLYCLGRLILLVEILRTLFFLPPNAFMATFASNIPHVS
ncbi:hypothetical protein V8E51_017494 [Hyaloscypha variabilis]